MDVLADLLSRARARGAVFALAALPAPWGIAFREEAALAFHAVLAGEAWLTPPGGGGPLHLRAGDVALVRAPGDYAFAASPTPRLLPLAEAQAAWLVGERRYRAPGDGPPARLLCGAYRFSGDLCDGLLAALPPALHLPADAAGPALERALAFLRDEVEGDAPGQQAVLDRLLDLLLVLALRRHFDHPEAHPPAWYRALGDPALARVLRRLHAEPARAWTVEGLAREAGLSRAAFARRFTGALGTPPLQYLTTWRMELAAELLRESPLPLAAIARQVGYGSEFAFSAAFKRERGLSPTSYRRTVRARTTAA